MHTKRATTAGEGGEREPFTIPNRGFWGSETEIDRATATKLKSGCWSMYMQYIVPYVVDPNPGLVSTFELCASLKLKTPKTQNTMSTKPKEH